MKLNLNHLNNILTLSLVNKKNNLNCNSIRSDFLTYINY